MVYIYDKWAKDVFMHDKISYKNIYIYIKDIHLWMCIKMHQTWG